MTPATITPNLKGGLVSDSKVKLHGAVSAIGFDYQAETPAGTGVGGVRNGAFEDRHRQRAGCVVHRQHRHKAPSKAVGTPNTSPSQSGFYSGPWDVLNMSQSQFYNWIGPAQGGARGKRRCRAASSISARPATNRAMERPSSPSMAAAGTGSST